MEVETDTRATGEMTGARGMSKGVVQDLIVRVGKAQFPVVELSGQGFVITADGRPPLRGFADIFRGNERVLRGLVTCAWTEEGRVGYEFKHATQAAPIGVDHVPQAAT